MGKLKVEKRVLGMIHTNVYLAVNTETKEAIFIDPADDAGRLEKDIEVLGVKPMGILLTHGHFDHIGAAKELAEHYGIPIGAGSEETEVLADPCINMSGQFTEPFGITADCLYADGEIFFLAGFRIRVIHTPGHTKGGVCYYLPEEGVLFSGDTLFCGTIGRTDLPTGSMSALVRSVRGLLADLPDETAVYPGHSSDTTIAYEKEYNSFV